MPSTNAALRSCGLMWWTWILGEQISWQHGDPTGDRLDLFGTAGLCGDALDVWNFGYGEREEDEGSKLIPLHRRERSVRRGCLRLSGRYDAEPARGQGLTVQTGP